jgi:DNA repair protein RAD50
MQKTSNENIENNAAELQEWETELQRLQTLLPVEAAQERLRKTEIPALEQQKKEQETIVPEAGEAAEKVRPLLGHLRS